MFKTLLFHHSYPCMMEFAFVEVNGYYVRVAEEVG
jgi:hypothetical protein